MPRKESHLNAAELGSLQISKLIFHVHDPREPAGSQLKLLSAEVPLARASYGKFFTERLQAASRGTQFKFDGEHLPTRDLCAELARTPAEFVEKSQQIATAFSQHHRGRQMAAGVIIIALAQVQVEGRRLPLVFILKVDHRPALSYALRGDPGDVSATVTHIADALVEDRASVQRSALIDVSDHFAWDVLASERNEGTAPDLREFFRAFLSVVLREEASVLTRKAFSAAVGWAKDLSEDDLPSGESWPRYKERATQYMKDHAEFDTAEFISMVVRDDQPERKARLSESLRLVLVERGIEGQVFATRADSLPDSQRRTKITTAEGVSIVYSGAQDAHRIEVRDDPENGPGAKTITIRTRSISEHN